MSHNQFQFIGNLTRDADVRQSENGGGSRAMFDLAVNRTWRGQNGERQEVADFFRVKCFNALADNAGKYLGKGSKVFVQGRIEPTKFEKEGKMEYGFDFIADKIEYLDTKEPGQRSAE
jgi:single-strand DNA-binding protein